MDDLYRNIRQSNSQQPAPSMPAAAWQEFDSYRQSREQPKVFPWGMALAVGLGVLLMLSNIWWWKFSDSTEISANQNGTESLFLQNRGGEENTVIVYRDTIYINKYMEIPLEKSSQGQISIPKSEYEALKANTRKLSSALNTLGLLSVERENLLATATTADFSNILDKLKTQIDRPIATDLSANSAFYPTNKLATNVNAVETWPKKQELRIPFASLGQAPFYPVVSNGKPLIHRGLLLPIELEQKRTLGHLLRPTSFAIYTEGGFLMAHGKNWETHQGGTFGLGLSLEFLNRIRTRLGFYTTKTGGNLSDTADNPLLPTVAPPTTASILEGIYFKNTNYAAAVGIDYLWYNSRTTSLYFGLDYRYSKSQYKGFRYEFKVPFGESYVSAPNLAAANRQFIGWRGGAAFKITDQVDLLLSMAYYTSIKGEKGGFYHLSPGIYYRFF